MTARKPRPSLTPDELRRPFSDGGSDDHPPIMSPEQLAALCGKSVKTIYYWMQEGRLNGAFRKRGKHVLIWRDRALDILFNGPDWTHEERREQQ